MKNIYNGFTLIELLVVIAIIGILASIVLTNLTSAKNKASDAAVMEELKSAQTQAAVFGDDHDNDYSASGGVCNDPDFAALTNAAALSYDKTGGTAATCNFSATAWAAYVPLKAPVTGTGWCVDSTGNPKASTALGAGTVCP